MYCIKFSHYNQLFLMVFFSLFLMTFRCLLFWAECETWCMFRWQASIKIRLSHFKSERFSATYATKFLGQNINNSIESISMIFLLFVRKLVAKHKNAVFFKPMKYEREVIFIYHFDDFQRPNVFYGQLLLLSEIR